MKKIFATILYILACAVFTFAQTETPTEPNWATFAPENEEFSIDAPVSLSSSETALPASLKQGESAPRRYLNTLNGTYFYIFSDSFDKPFQYRRVLDFAYASNQLETTQKSGELTTTKFQFSDSSDFYHTILAVSGKNRIYVFQTVSATKNDPLVERFFSSIKFNQKSLFENSPDTKTKSNISVTLPTSSELTTEPETLDEPEIIVKKAPTPMPEIVVKKAPEKEPEIIVKKQPDGYGLGNGRSEANQKPEESYGIGSGRSEPVQTAPEKITAGVRILSKPRANYTDFARFYEIQGKVVLRVLFSKNGTIDGVTAISKLPFGLTEEAIIAVRGIRFEPAMRAGVAYSVTKPVEYMFTIY